MKRRPAPRPLSSLLVALTLAGTASCSDKPQTAKPGGAEARRIEVVDADSTKVDLTVPVHRVVSLVPSATQTLDALGARSLLVGRTDFDTATWSADIPSVGGGLHPSVETIVSLHPDLVILFGGRQDPQTPTRLDELGIPHIAIRPDRIADVKRSVEILGRVTGHLERADSLVSSMDRELAAVRTEVTGLPHPRVAYVLGGQPPWVAGPGTYIDELIGIAGGINVFADLDRLYAPVSPEQLVARRPDVVLLPPGATFDRTLVPGARVETVNGDLERPGPDVAEQARGLARLIHGSEHS